MDIREAILLGPAISSRMILTVGDASVALISNGNERFFLLDSHSQNSEGLVDPYGSAVLMEFLDLDNLVSYLINVYLYTICL